MLIHTHQGLIALFDHINPGYVAPDSRAVLALERTHRETINAHVANHAYAVAAALRAGRVMAPAQTKEIT